MPSLSRSSTIISTVLVASLLHGCGQSDADTKKEDQIFAIPVAVSTLERGAISANYHSTAILESIHDAQVISRVTGLIEKLVVEEGDYVTKGQLIAEIDSRRYQLRLAQADAELASVNQELRRVMTMHKQQLVSADRVDKLTYQQQAAKATRELAALDLKDSHIIAPISGFIAEKSVKQGNFSQVNQQLLHIVDQENLRAIVHLPEHQLGNVKLGQTAYLTFSALPHQQFIAKVRSISPVINTQSGTFKLIMSLDNSKLTLKPGMFAQLALVFATHNDALRVPSDAIIKRDGQQYVFVITDNKAQEVPVNVGFIEDQLSEISGKIDAGAQIVISGQHNLKADVLVNVLNSLTAQSTVSTTAPAR